MIEKMTVERFAEILPKICKRDTSCDPKGWALNNPFWGHASVVSLLAQSLFQGGIFAVDLKDTKFAKLNFHCWNIFPDYDQRDFTRDQFGDEYPGELLVMQVEVASLLSGPGVAGRFRLLQMEFQAEIKK